MQPTALIAQLPNGQLTFKAPNGKDLVWLLGWVEMAKATIMQQIAAQSQAAIEVANAQQASAILRNGN